MDAKYLAEIKTRDNAELPKTAAPVFRDRHALLTDVERLGQGDCHVETGAETDESNCLWRSTGNYARMGYDWMRTR